MSGQDRLLNEARLKADQIIRRAKTDGLTILARLAMEYPKYSFQSADDVILYLLDEGLVVESPHYHSYRITVKGLYCVERKFI